MQSSEALQQVPAATETSPSQQTPLQKAPLHVIEDGDAGDRDRNDSSGEKAAPEEETRLLAEEAADPEVRMDRVRAIQAAIAEGSYEISAHEVAAKLINHLLKHKR